MYKRKNYKSKISMEIETIEETQNRILSWFTLKGKALETFEYMRTPYIYGFNCVIAESLNFFVSFPKRNFQNLPDYAFRDLLDSPNMVIKNEQNMKVQINIFYLARLLNLQNSNIFLVKFLGSYYPAHRLKLLIKAAFLLGYQYVNLVYKTDNTCFSVFEIDSILERYHRSNNTIIGIMPLAGKELRKRIKGKSPVLYFSAEASWEELQNLNPKYFQYLHTVGRYIPEI